MIVHSIDIYRDGGTIAIDTDQGEFCIDWRIGPIVNGKSTPGPTRGVVFVGYPTNGLVANPQAVADLKAALAAAPVDMRYRERALTSIKDTPTPSVPPPVPNLHPDLVALKGHVDRLHGLLAAPEPGLMTWNEMVFDEWAQIARAYGDTVNS